jgi:hypothetical protein
MKHDEYIIFNCPHCNDTIQVFYKELNCLIFRHGVMKDTLTQIDPHLNKDECDRLKKSNLIYGCGKPFRLVKSIDISQQFTPQICDYI